MCFGLPCDKCIAEYVCGTVTGRIPSQPNTQELHEQLNIGSKWRRKVDGVVVEIRAVGVGNLRCEELVRYVQPDRPGFQGLCPTRLWRQKFETLPITASECKLVHQLNVDFADVEARVIAALEDTAKQHCGHGGRDLHKLRAAEIFNVKPSDVTPLMRRVGKAANFIDAYSNKE